MSSPAEDPTNIPVSILNWSVETGVVKTLSAMIGHISAETTLNIYSHVTDTMRAQAAAKIDREIGGTDAEMPEAKG